MKQYGVEIVQFDDNTFGVRDYEKNSRGKHTTTEVQLVDNVVSLDQELQLRVKQLYEKFEANQVKGDEQ